MAVRKTDLPSRPVETVVRECRSVQSESALYLLVGVESVGAVDLAVRELHLQRQESRWTEPLDRAVGQSR
jgi:hypothetical protein